MNTTNEVDSDDIISASEIGAAAIDILTSKGDTGSPLYLSRLGVLLSSHFKRPIRSILGRHKLRSVLEDSVGDKLTFEGQGANITVSLAGGTRSLNKNLRFDPVVWAAFSKPFDGHNARYLKITRPFEFSFDSASLPHNEIAEITTDDVADPLLPKPERDRQIIHLLDQWCARNSIQPSLFLLQKNDKTFMPGRNGNNDSQAIAALRAFISAIPEKKRGDYSLPLNLIYDLIGE